MSEVKEPVTVTDPPQFEIAVSATTEWPDSCTGIRPVIEQVQKMLEAAANGHAMAFVRAMDAAYDRAEEWYEQLWGDGK